MRVFVSWSGQKSKVAAEVLREWIPNVLQSIEPFISSQDIETGVPWFNEIKRTLDETSFGIVCLTKKNCLSPWLLYEVGALAHRVEHPNVVPILLDLSPRDIPSPISFFQAIEINKDAFFRLVKALNMSLGEASLSESRLEKVFDMWWPDLEKQLSQLPKDEDNGQEDLAEVYDAGSNGASIDEILELVRSVSVKTDSVERLLRNSFDKLEGYSSNKPFDWSQHGYQSEKSGYTTVKSMPNSKLAYTEYSAKTDNETDWLQVLQNLQEFMKWLDASKKSQAKKLAKSDANNGGQAVDKNRK
ncbi:MAG: toll/interleukin-1 receptor domain-containing protein [Marinobacter sp.]|nr:toll/interleukin-1 receptor domain-containing protein [Marinobacter sp.]